MNKSDLPYMPTASFLHKNQFADYQWYIFGGQYFWELRLDSETLAGEVMKTRVFWDKMPTMPDAIVQTRDGSIYVFKKNVYNKYDHRRVLLEKRKSLYEDFLGAKCLNQARSQRKQRRRNN
ncbi:hypothetical protein DPMN_012521 [Dreissena polymorpha]|uniref:Uncharacterized protein n=1 Tax=Dreissena polymorpha TaxID=45954 RepID=A0A9D4N3K6_DREPO|nr:hypothetical protein DPMN_012521 [Dreissena polymorpha]